MRLASLVVLSTVLAAPSLARADAPSTPDAPPVPLPPTLAAPAARDSLAAPDALAAYQQHAVGVRNLGVAGRNRATDEERQAWMYPGGKWDAFQGPDHHPISEEAFFRIVGRDDLLTRYRHEELAKNVLTATGGLAIAGGLIFAWIDYSYRHQPVQISYTGNPPPPPGISPAWGFVIAGAGLVTMIVSHSLDPTPIDADEADRLARDYDRSLRGRLGLTDTAWLGGSTGCDQGGCSFGTLPVAAVGN